MVWFLFIHSDNDFKHIEFTFSNGYNKSFDRTFDNKSFDSWDDIQLRIIETINLNVSLRQSVYVVCDIRLGVYEYLCDKITRLFSRTNGVIDLQSFMILNYIKTQEDSKWMNSTHLDLCV
jgi:hypothetical protein